ncbi:MAG: DMT family transporter [Chloroflexota bacterium]|nr:DMT family transporter [Chloroflexota bacterium]
MSRRPVLDIADGAMLLTAVIWAGNNLVVKDAVADIDPVAYVVVRFALGVAVLFPALHLAGIPVAIPRRDWPALVLAGVSGFAIYNTLYTVGLETTSAFSAALLVSLGPVFTALIAVALGLEAIRPRQWLGIVVAVAGVSLFVGDKLSGATPVWGDLLALGAALTFSVYSLANRQMTTRSPAAAVIAWSTLVGLACMVPFGLPATLGQDWVAIGLAGWGALLYSSVLSMLVGYSLWAWGIGRRGVGRTVPYLYLTPILTGILAVLFQGEQFGPLKLAGAAVTLLGLALTRTRLPVRTPPDPVAATGVVAVDETVVSARPAAGPRAT